MAARAAQPDNGPQRRALTDRLLRSLAPAAPGQRETLWDGIVPSLAVRVTDRATLDGRAASVSFVVMRRRAGDAQPTRVTLGRYPAMSLAEARAQAREAVGLLAAGTTPAQSRQREREERTARTFGAIAERFIREHVSKLRTARAVEATIRRELIPVLGERPIGEIRRRDLIGLVEAIVARGANRQPGRRRPKAGGPHSARHTLAAARKLFGWALARDIEGLQDNPCGAIKAADLLGPLVARDRVLRDDELRLVWRAAEEREYPFGSLVKLLILTGQRLREIAEAQWNEVDLGARMLTVPAARMKGKVAHSVPLSEAALAILAELPRFTGPYVFSTTGGARPISGFSKMKARFDRKVAEIVARERAELIAAGMSRAAAAERVREVAQFTIHDVRRTVRTGLAAAGVPVFDAELIVAHRQSGVHATYDLHRYDHEKRAGLERWEARLRRIVEPPPSADIVPLRAGRRPL